MIRLLTLALLAAAPCSAAAAGVKPVSIIIPGTGASIAGYAIPLRGQDLGLSTAFNQLTGPIVAGYGSPYQGESWQLSKMLVTSVQKIAPTISKTGVALAKIGPALILMPRDAEERGPKAKIAVIFAGDSLTYRSTTMRDLSRAYEKALAATPEGAATQFDWFPMLFDGGKQHSLPGLPTRNTRVISLGSGTHMRPSEWDDTKQRINALVANNN